MRGHVCDCATQRASDLSIHPPPTNSVVHETQLMTSLFLNPSNTIQVKKTRDGQNPQKSLAIPIMLKVCSKTKRSTCKQSRARAFTGTSKLATWKNLEIAIPMEHGEMQKNFFPTNHLSTDEDCRKQPTKPPGGQESPDNKDRVKSADKVHLRIENCEISASSS